MSEKKVTLRWFFGMNPRRKIKVFLTSRPRYVLYGNTVLERTGENEYCEDPFGFDLNEKEIIKDFVIVKEPDRVELKSVPE